MIERRSARGLLGQVARDRWIGDLAKAAMSDISKRGDPGAVRKHLSDTGQSGMRDAIDDAENACSISRRVMAARAR